MPPTVMILYLNEHDGPGVSVVQEVVLIPEGKSTEDVELEMTGIAAMYRKADLGLAELQDLLRDRGFELVEWSQVALDRP